MTWYESPSVGQAFQPDNQAGKPDLRLGLRYNEKGIVPGAQTERRGEAGPGRDLLGGETSPAALFFARRTVWQSVLFCRTVCKTVLRQIPSTSRPDNEPNNQASLSVAACPAAANTASVAGMCDADTVSEAGGAIRALACGTAGPASASGGPALEAAQIDAGADHGTDRSAGARSAIPAARDGAPRPAERSAVRGSVCPDARTVGLLTELPAVASGGSILVTKASPTVPFVFLGAVD